LITAKGLFERMGCNAKQIFPFHVPNTALYTHCLAFEGSRLQPGQSLYGEGRTEEAYLRRRKAIQLQQAHLLLEIVYVLVELYLLSPNSC